MNQLITDDHIERQGCVPVWNFQTHHSTLNNINVCVRERKMAWKLVTAVTAATLLARKLLKAKRKKEEKGKGLFTTAVSSLISGSF